MLSEVMVETVQKFNRIEASDQSTIQLSFGEGVIIINLNVNMKRKILTEKIFYNIYLRCEKSSLQLILFTR